MTPEFSVPKGTNPGEVIDHLKPDSPLHAAVLAKLKARIQLSEKAMEAFYPRWGVAEKQTQAYIELPEYENMLKEMNEAGKPPELTSITVPYTFSTISTIVTYLAHVFMGRKPMFPIGAQKGSAVEASKFMETLLQYNAEHTRLVKHLFQFFNDGEMYGLAVLKTEWQQKTALRSVFRQEPVKILGIPTGGMQSVRSREQKVVFEGTDVKSIDPYLFFPDPRVPMADVNKDGEFVFWRNFTSRNTLVSAEGNNVVKYIDKIPKSSPGLHRTGESFRNLKSGGNDSGRGTNNSAHIDDFIQVDQGTVDLIPSDWGLGDGTVPEKWVFSIGNMGQIVQAEPIDTDHGMHPVAVAEPYTMGYGFGNASISDYLGPIQETVSWFVNSHIHNVRNVLNNMFVVDPSMIEMQDLKDPKPGKMIRLKEAAMGQDVRKAIQQLNTTDVTRTHVQDLSMFMRMGDTLSAVNDNLKGMQNQGGRKTATEVRSSNESGSSRLASHARLYSAQAITDLTEQMSLNYQQFLTEEFMVQIADEDSIYVSPEMIVGDFTFPVSDGTLPIDKIAFFDLWQQLYLGISQDPELRQGFDMVNMFEFIAELGGAQNISKFRIETAGPQVPGQVDPLQAGNGVPLNEVSQALGAL